MYQEYLSEIDNVPLFPIWLIVTLAVMIIGFIFLFVWIFNYEPCFLLEDALTLFSIFMFLSVGLIGFSFYKQSTAINDVKDSYEKKAPSEWVKKSEESLYSMDVQDKYELQGSGGTFLNQISSKDFIDYRYVIKTENGYQLRTLSKQYPGLSEGDIYIQEKAETVSPKIILEQRQYKEKEFNKVFGTGEKRVIFVVPEGTVQTKFEEGVIK